MAKGMSVMKPNRAAACCGHFLPCTACGPVGKGPILIVFKKFKFIVLAEISQYVNIDNDSNFLKAF